MSQNTVSMSSANSIVCYLERNGYLNNMQRQHLLNTLGLSEDDITSLEQRLALQQYHALWQEAQKLTADPALGLHIGMEHHPNLMSLVSNLWVHSETAEQGMERYVEYCKILHTGMSIRFDKGEHFSSVIFEYNDQQDYCQADMERTLGLNAKRARQYLGEDMEIIKVSFMHAQPDYYALYEDYFRCPVEFNAPRCSIVFASEYLKRSSEPHNPYVFSALREQAEKLKKSLLLNKTTEQVANIIAKQLHVGNYQLDDIAKRLHMNRQTLYRRLKAEDQNFKDLLDNIRQAKAMELIQDRNMSLSEIAYYLGFSEISAFSRAFKRWTGETPTHYRQVLFKE